jgi:hypothetical protein
MLQDDSATPPRYRGLLSNLPRPAGRDLADDWVGGRGRPEFQNRIREDSPLGAGVLELRISIEVVVPHLIAKDSLRP